jgi:hypothetical protein
MCNCTSEKLEIPGLAPAHHPEMTLSQRNQYLSINDGGGSS